MNDNILSKTVEQKTIQIFDTHAHLDLEAFDGQVDETVARIELGQFPNEIMLREDVLREIRGRRLAMAGVLLPGIDIESSRRCIEIARRSTLLHASVAIHPNSVEHLTEANWKIIEQLSELNDVVAIGETGLDRYWDRTPFDIQLDYFRRHLHLARRRNKPILIHCRDAWGDMLPILRAETDGVRVVIHAFSGTPRQAEECVELGFSISFAGSLTYTNKKFAELWEAAKIVPYDRLLIETDSPFMTPHPYRGKLKRNEPALALLVACRLAHLRDETLEHIALSTTYNARRMFQIDP